MPKLPVEKRKATKGKPPAPVPVHIVDMPTTARSGSSDKFDERERKWKAEDALRDIERAEGHKSDKALMKDVRACAKEKMQSLSKVASGPKDYKGD